jgi:hypothetical protein
VEGVWGVTRAHERGRFARRQGYTTHELVAIIEQLG